MSSTVPTNEDLYETLGVAKDATESEIQRAYRKLALKFHPDRNPGDASASDKFKKASEAYEILKDPEKRKLYDTGGMERVMDTGYQGFTDNEEIYTQFGDIFGQMFGERGRASRSRPRRGNDLKFSLSIDFRTAVLGGKTTVEVPIPVACHTCQGSGITGDDTGEACRVCHGSGNVARQAAEQGGYFTISSVCTACGGTGRGGAAVCPDCHGEGRKTKNQTISITIPAGIQSGKILRLQGQGEAGLRGGPNGDLLIEVQVKSDPNFRRDGKNIRSDAHVPLLTALLGGKMDVPTIHGTVTLTVPAGTSSDQSLRIRGQGIKSGSPPGDHLVRIVVDVPRKEFSESEKEDLKTKLG